MGIMNYGDVGSLRQAVDPAMFGADVSGTADSRAAWQRAIDYAVAMASRNGGVVHIKPSPGTYRIDWDGATGYNVTGGATTGINYRSCFVINALVSTAVKKVIFDFTGCYLIHGGTDWTDWASMFITIGCEREVRGGTYDYVNLPFFQGLVTEVGTGYIKVEIDPTFDQAAPTFAGGWEICAFSALNYALANPTRYPTGVPVHRSSYTLSQFTIADEGAGIYECSGLTTDEDTAVGMYIAVGTTVVVKGAKDGVEWFKDIDCPRVTTIGNPVCHASASRWVVTSGCSDITEDKARCVPRPGSTALAVTMRAGTANFNARGKVNVTGGKYWYTGDDAIAITSSSITGMTRVSATVVNGFTSLNYFSTVAEGTHFILYDSTHTEVARGTIDTVGTTNSSTFKADYTLTFASGNINAFADAAALTSHIMVLLEYHATANVAFNNIKSTRGRGVYTDAMGHYAFNHVENCTDTGILVQTSKGGFSENYDGGFAYLISDNTVDGACRNFYYPAAISVFCASPADSTVAARNYPISDVAIVHNTIRNCQHMPFLLGGVKNAVLYDNIMDTVNTAAPSGEMSIVYSFASKTLVGLVNCSNIRGNVGMAHGHGSSTLYTANTMDSGANSKIFFSALDWDCDLATPVGGVQGKFAVGRLNPTETFEVYAASGAASLLVEATSTNHARLDMKNGSWAVRLLASANGMFVYDVTNAAARFGWSTAGHYNPQASETYDIGNIGAYLRNLFAAKISLKDGVTAPVAVSGTAQLFVDAADGDLKVIFGDGTIKVISADT